MKGAALFTWKMEEEYIDIANWKQRYVTTLERLDSDARISSRNRELIRSFLRDASLGKTVVGRRRKKIGPAALVSYISQLTTFLLFVKKDLDKITNEDMEKYIEALETDIIRSRARRLIGGKLAESGAPYSPRYKVDNKVVIRKFYKWLWGENKRCPQIVEWFDTFAEDKEVSALTVAEVERLIDRGHTPLQRAFIQVLFDGGFRLGEILNVRLKHVQARNLDERNSPLELSKDSEKHFSIRAVFSKTLPRTVFLPMPATTKWLQLWLEEHPARPRIRPDGTLDAGDVNAQLFPMTDSAARHMVTRLGQRVLNKRVYPHLLRHSSATYWCSKLSHFQLCKRFGWTMTSDMPRKYIDREGVEDFAAVRQFHADERLKLAQDKARLQAEVVALKAKLAETNKEKIELDVG